MQFQLIIATLVASVAAAGNGTHPNGTSPNSTHTAAPIPDSGASGLFASAGLVGAVVAGGVALML